MTPADDQIVRARIAMAICRARKEHREASGDSYNDSSHWRDYLGEADAAIQAIQQYVPDENSKGDYLAQEVGEERHYDARLSCTDTNANTSTFETPNGQTKLAPIAFQFNTVGEIGVLTYRPGGECWFHAYPDQRLRRAPDADIQGDPVTGIRPYWGWRIEGNDESFLGPPHFVPGRDGRFIEAVTEDTTIAVPSEFIDMCAERGLEPEEVLRGFIADVCALQNYLDMPRADGYSSNGSDERMLAEQWFDRAYPTLEG